MYQYVTKRVSNVDPEGWLQKLACESLEALVRYGHTFHVGHDSFCISFSDPHHRFPSFDEEMSMQEAPKRLAPYAFRVLRPRLAEITVQRLMLLMNAGYDGECPNDRRTLTRAVYGRADWLHVDSRNLRTMAVRSVFGAIVARMYDLILDGHPAACAVFDEDFDAADAAASDSGDDNLVDDYARAQVVSCQPSLSSVVLASAQASM